MTNYYRIPLSTISATNTADFYQPLALVNGAFATAEAIGTIKFFTAGKLANLRITATSNSASNDAIAYVRINGVNSALAVTITAGVSSTFEDSTHTVDVSAGDTVTLFVDRSDSGSISLRDITCGFLTTTPTSVISNHTTAATSFSNASATRYINLIGTRSVSASEAPQNTVLAGTCTLANVGQYIDSNARGTDTVFTARKNSADTGITFTVGAGQTGFFQDTTNTASMAAGDLFCLKIGTGTGTGALGLGAAFANVIGGSDYFVTCTDNVAGTNNTTRYTGVIGGASTASATESTRELTLKGSGTISKIYAYAAANTCTVSSVYTVRKNGADTGITFTVGASTTGTFSDTSNSFTYADGDTISLQCVRSGGSGTLTLNGVSVLFYPDAESFGGGFQAAWARNSNFIMGVMQ